MIPTIDSQSEHVVSKLPENSHSTLDCKEIVSSGNCFHPTIIFRELDIKKYAGQNFGAALALVGGKIYIVYVKRAQYIRRSLITNSSTSATNPSVPVAPRSLLLDFGPQNRISFREANNIISSDSYINVQGFHNFYNNGSADSLDNCFSSVNPCLPICSSSSNFVNNSDNINSNYASFSIPACSAIQNNYNLNFFSSDQQQSICVSRNTNSNAEILVERLSEINQQSFLDPFNVHLNSRQGYFQPTENYLVNHNLLANQKCISEAFMVGSFNPVLNQNEVLEGFVYRETPAFKAGLSFGDRLISVNTYEANTYSVSSLQAILKEKSKLKLKVEDCKYVTLQHERSQPPHWNPNFFYQQSHNIGRSHEHYAKFHSVKSETIKKPDFFKDTGILEYNNNQIIKIKLNSIAFKNNLLVGERIVGINGKSLLTCSTEEVKRICTRTWKKTDVCLSILPANLCQVLLNCLKEMNVAEHDIRNILFTDSQRNPINNNFRGFSYSYNSGNMMSKLPITSISEVLPANPIQLERKNELESDTEKAKEHWASKSQERGSEKPFPALKKNNLFRQLINPKKRRPGTDKN
jgi:hypothetical protein